MKITVDTKGLLTWLPGETYRLEIEAGAIIDSLGDSNLTLTNARAFTTNSTGPTKYDSVPINNAVDVILDNEITIQYNRFLEASTGSLHLYKVGSPDVLVKTYVAADIEVDIHSDKIYLETFGLLESGQSYYVLVDSSAVTDLDGFATPAVTSTTDISFTTSSTLFPSQSTFYVANTVGEGSYLVDSNIPIGNTPLVAPTGNNINFTVQVVSNQSAVDNIEFGAYADYELSQTIINPDPDTYNAGGVQLEGFGSQVQFSSDNLTMVTSAYQDNSIGEVYVYTRSSTNANFTLFQTIQHSGGGVSSFGRIVRLSDNGKTLVIGSAYKAHIFRRGTSGTQYVQVTEVFPGPGADGIDAFQADVMNVSGDGIWVIVSKQNSSHNYNTDAPILMLYQWNTTAVSYNFVRNISLSETGLTGTTSGQLRSVKLNYYGNKFIAPFTTYTSGTFTATGYNVLHWSISNYSPWVAVSNYIATNVDGILNNSISGNYSLINNDLYDSFVYDQSLTNDANNPAFLTSIFGKIVSQRRIWDTFNAGATWVRRSEYFNFPATLSSDAQIYAISPDGEYIADVPTYQELSFEIYQINPTISFPWDNTTKTLTINSTDNTVANILPTLKLDVNAIPSSYNGEIKLKYTFDTTVAGGAGVGTLYRYQRAYDGIRYRVDPITLSVNTSLSALGNTSSTLTSTPNTQFSLVCSGEITWQFITTTPGYQTYGPHDSAGSDNYYFVQENFSTARIRSMATSATISNTTYTRDYSSSTNWSAMTDTTLLFNDNNSSTTSLYNTVTGTLIRAYGGTTGGDISTNGNYVIDNKVYNSAGSTLQTLSGWNANRLAKISNNYVAHLPNTTTLANGAYVYQAKVINISAGTSYLINPSSSSVTISDIAVSDTHVVVEEYHNSTFARTSRIINASTGVDAFSISRPSGFQDIAAINSKYVIVKKGTSANSYYEVRNMAGTLYRTILLTSMGIANSNTQTKIIDMSENALYISTKIQTDDWRLIKAII